MGPIPEPCTLSQGERLSPLWIKLSEHFTQHLSTLRQHNDGLMTEEKRGHLIGRIHEVKAFLKLGEDGPVLS